VAGPVLSHTDAVLAALLAAHARHLLTANLVFAVLYFLQPGSIEHARPGFFRDAFFVSVKTFGTIGYGVLAWPPTTLMSS
jgi:hypothetical protein